jgi:arabinofuranosyltransferase
VSTNSFRPGYRRVPGPLAPGQRFPTVVSGGIGALGYALGPDVTILDINGLADPLAGHLALVRRGEPGHEKILPAAWAAARVTDARNRPQAADFPIRASLSTPSAPDLAFSSQVDWARAALKCGPIADLQKSTERALTPRRFLSNLVHAISRAQRRVPSDPKKAYLRFCGPRPPRGLAATAGAASVLPADDDRRRSG